MGSRQDVSTLKSVTASLIEKFNPFHDERGRFSSSEGGEQSAYEARSERELEQRHVDYVHANEKAGKAPGPRGYFLSYKAKAVQTGNEPKKWKDLNSKVGNYEGMANAYVAQATKKGAEAWERKYKMARADTMRKAASQLAKQRDKIEVPKGEGAPAPAAPKPEEKSMEVDKGKAKVPQILTDDLKRIGDAYGYSAEEETRLPPEDVKQLKIGAVKDAVKVGMITEEEGKEIIAGL